MDEETVTMLEGVAREWRVRVMDSARNVLDPEGFSFYGAAADGVQVPRRMQVRVEGDVVVLVLPGLWMSGRCWRYQVLCQDVLTGVEWVLCQGDVVLERRVACNGPALHEDAVLVDAVLDSEATVMEVVLGDSTAATAEAARLAAAARAGADEAAARVAGDAARVEELKRVTLDVAAGAALAAERAEASKHGAEAAAGDAAADAQVAAGKAEEAEVSREAAEAAAKQAGARAAEAEASAKVAADAVSDALAARDEAAAARDVAEVAAATAEASRVAAEAAADDASVSRAVANAAQEAAEAAQRKAEQEASKAEAAAAAAQAPESLAAQAARPATMVLLKDELLEMVGAGAFDVDTDGQRIVVHTDRLEGEQLAAVEDMLGRFVPQFIEVARYNHHIEISWRDINKYAHCTTREELKKVNPKYQKDLTSEGEWIYPLDSYKGGENWLFGVEFVDGVDARSYVKKIKLYAPKVVNATYFFHNYEKLTEIDAYLPNAVEANSFARQGYVKKISGYFPKLKRGSSFLDNTRNVPVNEVDADFPALENGAGFLDKTRLIKSSVLRILNSIPAYTSGSHPLTIGIHVDHQNDEEVLAAIANAESKGWTLTVQWNGTPTSTASVMRFGQLIYARVSETERPDGTTEKYLDWGHYVTDEAGYETFRSLASAYEYFGLAEESEE